MPRYDLAPPELAEYDPQLEAPPDLEEFWAQTLAHTRAHDLGGCAIRIETPLLAVETLDACWRGFGGHTVRGWLHLPAQALRHGSALPAVVQFQGYNGGRGLPFEHVFWATAGYAHLVVDTRGQGSGWTVGDTGDPNGSDPAQPGFLTRGIADPGRYYYRRVYAGAVRAVEFMRTLAEVDPSAIAVTGTSQGGGLALATAALDDEVAAVMPDVPFLCDFRRASHIAPRRALRRDRPVPERAPGPRAAGIRDPGLLRLRDPGPCRHRAGAVLGSADGPDLPSLDRIRRIQRLRRPEGDRRLPVQRPRGWRGIPPLPADLMAGGRAARGHPV